jgi:hypothetical protein
MWPEVVLSFCQFGFGKKVVFFVFFAMKHEGHEKEM